MIGSGDRPKLIIKPFKIMFLFLLPIKQRRERRGEREIMQSFVPTRAGISQ
jgi:hypothetical protein